MKYAGDSGDPYLNKDTGVLRNLLGLKDQAGLDKTKSSLFFAFPPDFIFLFILGGKLTFSPAAYAWQHGISALQN